MEILTKNKYSHWWLDKNGKTKKDQKWAVQDSQGDWWLINGSEFPEQKVPNTSVNNKKKINNKIIKKYDYSLIILAAILGVSVAMNLILVARIAF